MTADPIAARSASADPGAPNRSYREVTDSRGRVYRVGETDRDILGHSRKFMVYLPWAAMMAISVFEYAYGSAEDTLSHAHGWTQSNTFWILSVWVFFQAGIAFPAGWLREKGVLTACTAMHLGAGMCLVGFLALSHLSNVLLAILGFGVVGGIGSGLVYATCINMVGKWFPERRGARTGFVNGGFAYGSLPFIFIFNYAFDTANYHRVLDLIGCYVMIVVLSSAFFFKDPPKNWWPADIDPLTCSGNGKSAASLAKNPPAVKQYTPKEAIRTGVLPLMWITLVMTAGVSIFGISFQVDFAKEVGFGPLVAASSMGIMAVINGIGRAVVGWLSDILGRKLTLVFVIVVLGLAQFGVIWAGDVKSEWLFLFFAFLSGFGGGAFYPMFAALTPDYFGENYNATNYGLVYSGKLISGLFGGGLGSMVVAAWGYNGAYALAGAISMVAAAIALLLKQPGRNTDRSLTPEPQPAG
ncbi:MFS transporter [Streptomyces avermitilis]|uniref:Transmembrane transport protein n=2 Tax=Streptomyces avermitilis TaxID=33903 RepID=Q82M37_STRAW|nr:MULTISPECIES: OFA family MFS transporter [Streptomyces]KUN55895.1 MFS transporter [Streptomyces avermitilis]MYS97448.1 MFS transporter [Streptomyces sp. SID5469]OOV25342.1 MFS transporter [Streptomyces avermitilis]BAC69534.1 putative transmembrane transport protein [Streptomyces avermitilis MA-4680 = NBRC 14893]BBJ49544.1 MFS transporter [Streptomyces avermitilis]